MELLFLILISIIFLFVFHGIDHYRRRKLPPGPVGFPIIGNLLEVGPKPHESLAKLAQKYGELMTIRMGSFMCVVASTPDAAREVLQIKDEVCSDRYTPDIGGALKNPEAAILWMPTHETWRAMRKVLNMYLTTQQKLDSLSDLRQNVVDQTLDLLRDSGRKKADVDIGKLAFVMALNQMSNTILSQNLTSYEPDNNTSKFRIAIEKAMELLAKLNIVDIFPVLKPFDPQNIRREAKETFSYILDEVMEGFLRERLEHRESNLPEFGDMLDSMLDYSQENEAIFNHVHIKYLILAVLMAGTEDTSNTVTWTMTELLLNPDILLRLREEVGQIVGKDGKIEEAKILGLPYLHAVIKESMRLHSSGPLLAPHKTSREIKLDGYTVPANTPILVNAWAIARDPTYWESPSSFMPERFLNQNHDIDYKGQYFQFIPFGSGRRRCPGMPLALRMVSLIVASFVYYFDWKLPHAKDEMDMDQVFALSLQKATPLVATPIQVN